MAVDPSVAMRFGELIAKGDFSSAHSLLTREARALYPPDRIKQQLQEMTAYASGPVLDASLTLESVLEEWQGKQPGDVAWVYVALTGETFNEAISVLLARLGEDVLIRELDWGRP